MLQLRRVVRLGRRRLLVEEAVDLDAHVLEPLSDLGVDVGELERGGVALRVLGGECEIDYPDRPVLDELGERGRDLTLELVAGEATIS